MPKVTDLTLTLRSDMRGVSISSKYTVAKEGWNASALELYSHCGTHMDAQVHFEAGDETIDVKPLTQCMGPAWVVDVSKVEKSGVLKISDLGDVGEKFEKGESLILKTGWSTFAEDVSVYRDQMPRIGDELATWCVESGVNILAVEPPSIADVNNLEEVTRIHKILLSGGVTIVEGLTNLNALTTDRVFFMALPIKVGGCDGAPVRALAFEDIDLSIFSNLTTS
ncbi:cyclase family protein [Verrucomicrobia bacterium]|nr:cyclase family protein [Verrucomicrobiota bacterium]